jgi:protein-L-isoaspartate(D-aspartate) O-methyltransferase
MDEADAQARNEALIGRLKRQGTLTSAAVEAAFRALPRHRFLPDLPLDVVYQDDAIITKRAEGRTISSSSQPTMMAIMLEQLDLRPGQRVLEIGTGTGFNAALLAHVVGPLGHVTTVDIDGDLVARARANLAAAGVQGVDALCVDGAGGYPPGAPYDRIVLTVGAWDVLPPWREQLVTGGRLVLPLGVRGLQVSLALDARSDHMESASAVSCGFMPLRGPFAGPPTTVEVAIGPRILLTCEDVAAVDVGAVGRSLTRAPRHLSIGVPMHPREALGGLALWIAVHESRFCSLLFESPELERAPVPVLPSESGHGLSTFGVVSQGDVALIEQAPASGVEQRGTEDANEFWVCAFGDSLDVAERLAAHVRAWTAAGRPAADHLVIRVYPVEAGERPGPDEQVIVKRASRLHVRWTRR